MEIVKRSVHLIDKAIERSHVDIEQYVYRGVQDANWMNETFIGGTFEEKAFGSFSLNIENAVKYTNPEKPIILRKLLTRNMKVLYIDNSEYEILFPRNIVNEIVGIKTKIILNSKTKVYTIKKKEV